MTLQFGAKTHLLHRTSLGWFGIHSTNRSCPVTYLLTGYLLVMLLAGCKPLVHSVDTSKELTHRNHYCKFMPSTLANGHIHGTIIGADILLPKGHKTNYGVHVRFNGSIGTVGKFDTLKTSHPNAAVLDCRGKAVLSPGFINAHEHPAFSYDFPAANLNPGYTHRDEWRFGLNGKEEVPSPKPYHFKRGDTKAISALVAMELRHLLGGATMIAGSGGVPGVIRNINLHKKTSDLTLYDAEATVSTFPYSYQVVKDLRDECSGGSVHHFPTKTSDNLTFTAYVPHVGEGKYSNCAARAEVERYLKRVQRRDRRYALVHGVATDRKDYAIMHKFDVTLVWSPRSNLALYGETVDIKGALEHGVRIAISTDWSPSGSFNMREEFKCAQHVAKKAGVPLTSKMLWHMATSNGAYALGIENRFGAIKPGLQADLILVKYNGGNPYDAVLTATDKDTLATWIGGKVTLLSDLMHAAISTHNCVTLDEVAPRVCGILSNFDLSAQSFSKHIKGTVPLNDVRRQAPCTTQP